LTKPILLYLLTVGGLAFVYVLVQYIRSEMLPGARRLRKNDQKKETAEIEAADSVEDGLDRWVRIILSPAMYKRIELFLSQNGQSYEWTVPKAIRNIVVSVFIGFFFSGLLTLMYFSAPNASIGLIAIAVITLPFYPIMPILIFKSGRKDFVTKIIYETPELLDILEAELVRGSGNVEIALERAQRDLEGVLRNVMKSAYTYLLKSKYDYAGTYDLIEKQINVPLYDQVCKTLKQYHLTGKAQKSLGAIQRSCRTEIKRTIRQQTMQKNLLITVVAMGILVNLLLLIGVPLLSHMMNVQFVR